MPYFRHPLHLSGGYTGRTSALALLLSALLAACGSDDSTSPSAEGTIRVAPTTVVLGVGTSRRLAASVLDAAGGTVPGAVLSFASSDPARAVVDAEGLVTYVGAGEAEISVSSDQGAPGRICIVLSASRGATSNTLS